MRIKRGDTKISSKQSKIQKLLTENQGVKTRFEEWIATNPKPEIKGQILHLDFEKGHGKNASVPGKYGNAVKLTGDDAIGTKVGNFRRFQPFSVSLWMKAEEKMERAVVFHRSRAWTDSGSRGYQLLIEVGN